MPHSLPVLPQGNDGARGSPSVAAAVSEPAADAAAFRPLPPHERARRRTIKNLIVGLMCLLILAIVIVLLLRR